MPWGDEEVKGKAYPVNVIVKGSETLSVTVSPALGVTEAKLGGIRIQNIKTHEWFNWDYATRKFDKTPVVDAGANLYVAVWAINLGVDGNVRIKAVGDDGAVLIDKTAWCLYWNGNINIGLGGESGTKTMPARAYTITFEVSP